MIKRIKKIKNLGLVFSDYNWASGLPEFKRFNLIYGWTGSGKTTLSNLFAALETGVLSKYAGLEYEVEDETESFRQGQPFNRKVRVFNQDYVSRNVGFIDGKANPIYILGEENQKLVESIKMDEGILLSKNRDRKVAADNLENAKNSKAKEFTNIARVISSNTSGEATRRYDKRDAEDAFVKLLSKVPLDESRIQTYLLTLKQLERPTISEVKIQNILDEQLGNEKEISEFLNEIILKGKDSALMTIESVVIERLRTHPDISEWVEAGLIVHKNHKSIKCEYCGQQLQESRVRELAQHFSETDKKLKDDVDALIRQLDIVHLCIENINPIDKANLYEELQEPYQSCVKAFDIEKEKILNCIDRYKELLKEKKAKTTDPMV